MSTRFFRFLWASATALALVTLTFAIISPADAGNTGKSGKPAVVTVTGGPVAVPAGGISQRVEIPLTNAQFMQQAGQVFMVTATASVSPSRQDIVCDVYVSLGTEDLELGFRLFMPSQRGPEEGGDQNDTAALPAPASGTPRALSAFAWTAEECSDLGGQEITASLRVSIVTLGG